MSILLFMLFNLIYLMGVGAIFGITLHDYFKVNTFVCWIVGLIIVVANTMLFVKLSPRQNAVVAGVFTFIFPFIDSPLHGRKIEIGAIPFQIFLSILIGFAIFLGRKQISNDPNDDVWKNVFR